jgi:toxin ParE1/3/4
MGRFRLAQAAQVDLTHILTTSEERWVTAARRRYEALVAAAMRKVADDPVGPTTRSRNEIVNGIRSFHLRQARYLVPDAKVREPVHVLYYRAIGPDLIEIARVLHERMEPSRYLDSET